MIERKVFLASLAACLLSAPAFAGPISGYPVATTPLSGLEAMIGTQSGTTVQVTASDIAQYVAGQIILNTPYAPVDASGTITQGGTFQQVFAANTSRVNCTIQNPPTATEILYVHYTSASPTTSNSVGLGAGSTFNCVAAGAVVTGQIQAEAATTGHAFVATGL